MSSEEINELRARLDIIEVVNRIALLADLREWTELRDCFCDEVDVDYTSEFGGEPERVSAKELMQQWSWLNEFQATQHQVTDHTITLSGEQARCRAHVFATHFMPNDKGESFWTCGGHYDYRLQRTSRFLWRVAGTKFTLTWARGNQEINRIAHERAQSKVSLPQ